MTDASSLTEWLSTVDPVRTIALIALILAAQITAHLALGRATRTARARATERASAWAESQRTVWRARAEARARRASERATDEARAERSARRGAYARVAVVAVVAVAATNLSAHAIQSGLAERGMDALNTRLSVFIVFEGVLAAAAGLSWWHQTSGRGGIDRYRIIVWAMAALMAYLAWDWSGDIVNGLWPLIAAGAWHEVVAAEGRRRHGGTSAPARAWQWLRDRLGPATSLDANERDRERRYSRIERRTVRANTAPRAFRWMWKRAHDRAMDAAQVRGYLGPEALRMLAERVALRYAGPSALAPDALDGLNPWADAIAAARTGAGPAHAAPVASAAEGLERGDGSASAGPRAADHPRPPAHQVRAGSITREFIEAHLTGPKDTAMRERVADYLIDHHQTTGRWPTGRELGDACGVHQGTGRKWLASVKATA